MTRSYKNRRACFYRRMSAARMAQKPFTKVTSPKSIVSANSTTGADRNGRKSAAFLLYSDFYTVRKPRRSVTLDPQTCMRTGKPCAGKRRPHALLSYHSAALTVNCGGQFFFTGARLLFPAERDMINNHDIIYQLL